MRPGQNNKQRMRGRPTNNRRGPNPLTRSYESNGPDVKIRGNAHHIAEKYLQLARDAHTSGDPVAAENYLQHAEHYYRLIAAAQAAQQLAQSGRPPGESEDDEDDEDDGGVLDRFASPAERAPAVAYNGQPQPAQPVAPPFPNQPVVNAPAPYAPFNDRQPFDGERPQGNDRQNFQPRQDRRDNRPDRGPRPDRQFGDRQEGRRDFRPYRDQNAPREAPPAPMPIPALAPELPNGLPSFITAGPRLAPPVEEMEQPIVNVPVEIVAVAAPIAAAPVEAPQPVDGEAPQGDAPAADGRFPRGRRRRLRSPYGFHAGHTEEGQPPAVPAATDDGQPPSE